MQTDRSGVVFPAGETGSSLLRGLLADAVQRWPEVFGSVALPAGKAFRTGYPDGVVRFEAARLASDPAAEIGRFLVESSQARMQLARGGVERPLVEALEQPGAPRQTRTLPLPGKGRLAPRIPYRGRVAAGSEIRELAATLIETSRASRSVGTALGWLLDHALDEAGELDLAGRRFAVMGAAAEIAPTLLLLEAGADVLWLDVTPPPAELCKDSSLSGRIVAPEPPCDLLADPSAVAATLRAFADESGAVDVCLYAYAPGGGREWRLTESMNAIVDTMPAGSVRSVSMPVSPTTPVRCLPESLAEADRRYASRPLWQRALEAAGALAPGHVGQGDARLPRNVVSVQGPGYQAAQYVGKTLAAERWARSGPTGHRAPVRVSANTAAITMTRSLRHPVFEAAFEGAGAFGVEAFSPDATRALNGLLLLHDLLREPEAPAPGGAQVHGGLFAVPYELEPAIRVSALIGLARRPGLVPGLLGTLVGRGR